MEADPLVVEKTPVETMRVYAEGVSADEAVAEMETPHESGEPVPWTSQ